MTETSIDFVLLGDIAQAAMAVTRGDMATVQIVSREGLKLAGSRGIKPDVARYFDIVRADECSCGRVLQTREPVIVDDVRSSPLFVGAARAKVLEAGTLSVVSMPILSRQGRLLGVVTPHRRTTGRPDAAALRRLEWLAGQAAHVIEGTASMSLVRGLELLARP